MEGFGFELVRHNALSLMAHAHMMTIAMNVSTICGPSEQAMLPRVAMIKMAARCLRIAVVIGSMRTASRPTLRSNARLPLASVRFPL